MLFIKPKIESKKKHGCTMILRKRNVNVEIATKGATLKWNMMFWL